MAAANSDDPIVVKIKERLVNTTFLVTKSVSVPKQSGNGDETALFIEHVSDKTFGYMLVVKVPEDNSTEPIKTLSEPSAKNKEFKINEIGNIEKTTISITITPAPAPVTAPTAVNVYTVKNVDITGIASGKILEMFVLEVNRQKSGKMETFLAKILPKRNTDIQNQLLTKLEDEIISNLRKIIIKTGEYNIIDDIANKTIEIRKCYNIVNLKDNTQATNCTKLIVDEANKLNLDDINLNLITTIKKYRKTLSYGKTPFKLPHRGTGSIFKKFSDSYIKDRREYVLIYEYFGAISGTWTQNYAYNIITGKSKDAMSNVQLKSIIDEINTTNAAAEAAAEAAAAAADAAGAAAANATAAAADAAGAAAANATAAAADADAAAKAAAATAAVAKLKNLTSDTNLNTAQAAKDYLAIEKLKYINTIFKSLPTEETFFVKPTAMFASKSKFQLPIQNGGALTSVVYQKRRYNVHRDEHDRATIHLKKKAYVLKESSKGLYITVDGKREYVK